MVYGQLRSPSLCQCRDDHSNVYLGDKCLNDKAASQKVVSFLQVKIVAGIDFFLHSEYQLCDNDSEKTTFFRGIPTDSEKHVDMAYC